MHRLSSCCVHTIWFATRRGSNPLKRDAKYYMKGTEGSITMGTLLTRMKNAGQDFEQKGAK